MNLKSSLFDSIRVKSKTPEVAPPQSPPCAHAACAKPGDFRAPMGRNHEGMFFCFCAEHVKEYNASYNYFDGMSDAEVAKYQKEAIVGHRPTWAMGVKKQAGAAFVDPMGMFGGRAPAKEPEKPRRSYAAQRGLKTLGLDERADKSTIRSRYKELVKQFHPDANGGDRAHEERLREIIRAYKELKTAGLA